MRSVASFVAAALISLTVVASAQQPQTYVGVVTDTMCGANHAAMKITPDSTCVKECVRHGGTTKLALVQGKSVYLLSDQETPAKFAARKVKVTGVLYPKTNVLKVDRVEPLD